MGEGRKPIRCEDEGHEFACRLARKTCWTCTGAPSQRQDSLADQLLDVLVLARAHGMYDAEDWIIARLEVRASAATPRELWGTCCPNDPECEHSFMDDEELARYLDTPLTEPSPSAAQPGADTTEGDA